MVKKFGESNAESKPETPVEQSRFSPFEDKNNRRLDAIGESVWGTEKKDILPPDERDRILEEINQFFTSEALPGAKEFSNLVRLYIKGLSTNKPDAIIEFYQELTRVSSSGNVDLIKGLIAGALANYAHAVRGSRG